VILSNGVRAECGTHPARSAHRPAGTVLRMGDAELVVHGHFYQPPRENPWTEVVPAESSAAPYHDWNERITAECYRPNGWARVVDEGERVVDIVNCFELLSFDVGPTLMSWLEQHHREVYDRIIEADRRAGRAIAQAFGHAILPLCNERDRRTQVRWGIADFVHRFGRRPEGMWLPETAVDDDVLACLADEGLTFTILAPSQIEAVRPLGDGAERSSRDQWVPWGDGAAGGVLRWRHPADPGLALDLVVYDGPLSHDLAFAGVSSQALVARAAARGGLVCAATDGETFGHHHTFAERGLAYALAVEAGRRGVGVPRLVDHLGAVPPEREARIRVSAWSCSHGVARWADDCGCHTGGEPGWSQAWRAPLRAALDLLRDWSVEVVERRGPELLDHPWEARDDYAEVLLGVTSLADFASRHVRGDLPDALTLLEAQRHALLMYTSCGWFFNDLAGLETVQILRYAARCIDLHRELGEEPPEHDVLALLAEARSNRPEEGDGRRIWEHHVVPTRVDPARVAAHIALVQLLSPDPGPGEQERRFGSHEVVDSDYEVHDRGGLSMCAGWVTLVHRRTRRSSTQAFAAVHLGGLEVFGAVREASIDEEGGVEDDLVELRNTFDDGGRVTSLLREVVDRFGPREFGLESTLPDAADQIVHRAAQGLIDRVAATYDQLRSDHHRTFTALARAGYQLPAELRAPIELALSRRFEQELVRAAAEGTHEAHLASVNLARAARAEGFEVRSPRTDRLVEQATELAVQLTISAVSTRGVAAASDVEEAVELVELARELGTGLDLSRAQELVFDALATAGDPDGHPLRPLGQALHLAVGRLARPD
jgi:hypothetical protein